MDKRVLDSPISAQEIKIAVRQMAKNKCPGLDGLPIEFYQNFWEDLTPTLHSVYLKAIEGELLNPTARQGVISLLDKPDRDLLRIKSWRPLTMLNGDYKIFAKMVANRLGLVLPQIMHSDQKGFIKGRKISHNLIELISIIQYCQDYNLPAYSFCVDFEKAFDHVEYEALYAVLRKFNFGEFFIKLVKVCLNGFTNSIMNNGYRSELFGMTRGLKQGCPYSPGGFDVIVEVIALKIRQNVGVTGIVIDGVRKPWVNLLMICGQHPNLTNIPLILL